MTDYKNVLEQIDELLLNNLLDTVAGTLSGDKVGAVLLRYAETLDKIDRLVQGALRTSDETEETPEETEPKEETDPTPDISQIFNFLGDATEAIFGKSAKPVDFDSIEETLKKLFGNLSK